ncbi:type IV secretory system conjugative DNA transfer family protein [Longispora albida]|uniref:type IV secretory system conjugative DNA transfer family protein n=1 Tax=Longispora albida TaxID=203523 RepID=UPI0003A062E6|nr:DUF87 domain-containing protein [Longispora albida]
MRTPHPSSPLDGRAQARPSRSSAHPSPEPASSRPVPARLRLVPASSPRRSDPKALGYPPLDPRADLVGVDVADARHHLHIPGPTGTGKSTLLLNMIIGEARAGRGVIVLDPKGDLIRDVLHRLPAEAAGRMVLIDPDEKDAPAAFNLFDLGTDPADTADHLVGVMAKVWASSWGGRIEDLARHAVATLAHVPGSTLADVPILLTDPAFRSRVRAQMRRTADPLDIGGLETFWDWHDHQSPGEIARHAGPLLSKLRAVLSRRFAADLLGTAASTFHLQDILDGGILLARLPKGTLGDDTVRLTGSLLLASVLRAAGKRGDLDEHDRLDATVIIDECHNFLNLPIAIDEALAETRGLRLGWVLAHQHGGQLTPQMAAAIDANARNKVYFSLAPADAKAWAHHTAPYFSPEDLSRRDAYGVVVRLVIDGRDAEPFSLTTIPPPPPTPGRAEALRAAARTRGLPAEQRRALAEARLFRTARPAARLADDALVPAAPDPGGWAGDQAGDRPVPQHLPQPPAPSPLTAQLNPYIPHPREKSD